MDFYYLEGHEVKTTNDARIWEKTLKDRSNRVDETIVGKVRVSTVFLGLDYNFGDDGPPVLFETMTFLGDDMGGEQVWRYCTWDEAQSGHNAVVADLEALGVRTGDGNGGQDDE